MVNFIQGWELGKQEWMKDQGNEDTYQDYC